MTLKVGILGVGILGGALKKYFEKSVKYEVFLYDKKGLGSLEELNKADYIYICLPTPFVPDIGCDISIIDNAIDSFIGEKVIIIKSTVPPGTTFTLQEKYPQHKFLFNPEFLTEATADQDMEHPDRQIIGYTEKSFTVAEDVMLQLPLAPYERIVPAHVAEFLKYAGNTWFAVKVAIHNELYDLATKFGLTPNEWDELTEGLAADKRVGRTHLDIVHKNKRGYWGKCLPKDQKALLQFAKNLGVDMPIREAANKYNDELLKSQDIKPYV